MKPILIRMGILSFLLISFLFALTSLLSWGLEKRVSYSYFYEALDALPETRAIIQWSDTQPKGRLISESNYVDFSTKITETWQAYALSMETGNANYLRDYFTDVALQRGLHVLESEQAQGANMVFMGMTVEPEVFHKDGSIFQFRSDDALFARFIVEDDRLVSYNLTKDCILSNMIIRQSGWKLSHHERSCSVPVANTPQDREWNLEKLKGINYYPKNSPWRAFWTDYDKKITARDVKRILDLDANSVRIFLPIDVFTDPLLGDQAISALDDFLEQTAEAGIWVIPTLFDFRGEVTPWSWSSDRYYLDLVLPVFAEADNIAYVDLKNEFDLDDRYQSAALSEAWVRTITGVSRQIAPNLRYSMGWSNAEDALRYADLFEVISYHDYGPQKAMKANLQSVQSAAGDKPVIVSEIGVTSYNFAFSQPSDENKQARDLQKRLDAVDGADGVFVWTLYDYPLLDEKAIGGSFWNKGIQKNFGLLGIYETPKPAADVFRNWSFK